MSAGSSTFLKGWLLRARTRTQTADQRILVLPESLDKAVFLYLCDWLSLTHGSHSSSSSESVEEVWHLMFMNDKGHANVKTNDTPKLKSHSVCRCASVCLPVLSSLLFGFFSVCLFLRVHMQDILFVWSWLARCFSSSCHQFAHIHMLKLVPERCGHWCSWTLTFQNTF